MKWNHTKFLMSAFLLSLVACSDDNTAGVTEDGNPAIAQGKSSSSAISSSGAEQRLRLICGTARLENLK